MKQEGLLLAALAGDSLAVKILGDWIEEGQHMPPYEVGTVWFFFGATRYAIGRVKTVTPFEVILEEASWVPSTGRMYDSLLSGEFDEVEPFPSGISVLNRFAIHDATPCPYNPPIKQK